MDDLLTPLLPSGLNSTSIDELIVDDVDTDSCRLLGPVALAVQGAMGILVIGGLLIKRMRERPRRKWKIWLADVGKQVVGQMAVHASNVAISDLIASNRSDNPCSLYALNIVIDTTLGVLLLYFLLQYSTILMQRFQPSYQTGFYGQPFSISLWAEQAAVYVACLAVMKVVVLIIFWIAPELEDGMSWGLSWIENEEAQVVIVMLILPLVMNLFQFLMVDSIIRLKDPTTPSTINQNSDEEALRRGFLEDASDNEDDDDTTNEERRHSRRGSRRTDDGGEDLEGGDEDDEGKQKQARELLFDADSPMVDQIPTMELVDRNSRSVHAYPPTSGGGGSMVSSSLPPYSALPPPSHSRATPTSNPAPRQVQRNHFADDRSDEGGDDDDEGWGEKWSASSETEEDPTVPLAHTSQPSTSSHVPSHPLSTSPIPPSTSSTSKPIVTVSSIPRAPSRSVSPPSRFFTPSGSGMTTPLPTSTIRDPFSSATSTTSTIDGQGATRRDTTSMDDGDEAREEEEEDWGFNDSSVSSPKENLDSPLRPDPSTFESTSPQPLPRLEVTAEDNEVRRREEEAIEEEGVEEEDDDWGFGSSSMASPSPQPSPSLPTKPIASPSTSQDARIDEAEEVPIGREEEEPRKEEEEEEAEDDDWGFDDSLSHDPTPVLTPSLVDDAREKTSKVLGLNEPIVEIEPMVKSAKEVGDSLGGLS